MASKSRSIFIKALGMFLWGGYKKTFCLCILLVKQICSDAFLLSLSTSLAICPVKWSENISVSPWVLEGAHSCFLGKQDHISCSSLPYVILKSKHVAKKSCPHPLHFQHQKPYDGLLIERISKDFRGLNFKAY